MNETLSALLPLLSPVIGCLVGWFLLGPLLGFLFFPEDRRKKK